MALNDTDVSSRWQRPISHPFSTLFPFLCFSTRGASGTPCREGACQAAPDLSCLACALQPPGSGSVVGALATATPAPHAYLKGGRVSPLWRPRAATRPHLPHSSGKQELARPPFHTPHARSAASRRAAASPSSRSLPGPPRACAVAIPATFLTTPPDTRSPRTSPTLLNRPFPLHLPSALRLSLLGS